MVAASVREDPPTGQEERKPSPAELLATGPRLTLDAWTRRQCTDWTVLTLSPT